MIEKRYKDLSHTHLRGMVNSVIFREDADPLAFLNALAAIEGGAEALANYFSEKWSRIEAFARTGRFDAVDDDGEILSESDLMASAYARPVLDHDEVADQDWMELAWLMRYECPDLFTEMLLVLRAKVRAFESGRPEFEDDEDEDRNKVETSETDFGRVTTVVLDSDDESAI